MSVHFVFQDDATTLCGLYPLEHLDEQLAAEPRLVTCATCRAVMGGAYMKMTTKQFDRDDLLLAARHGLILFLKRENGRVTEADNQDATDLAHRVLDELWPATTERTK